MTNGKHLQALLFILLFLTARPLMASDESQAFKNYLEKANNYLKTFRHLEAGEALKEATRLGGTEHPSLHMRLGILYYGLGLIPEAIAEGEKAVALAPSSKWYKYDLAKFYFVDKQYDKAEALFITLLKLDPGFTYGYYYLAELYFLKNQYDLAWLSMRRANFLGYQGKHLKEKLARFSPHPEEDFGHIASENLPYRFIKFSSQEKAKAILNEIGNGKLFENLELELQEDPAGEADFGVMMLDELQGSIVAQLREMRPYTPPIVIKTGEDFRILQKIVPFDPASWQVTLDLSASRQSSSREPTEPAAVEDLLPDSSAEDHTGTPATGNDTDKPDTDQEMPPQSSRLAALYVLDNWKTAWETANADGYFAAYSQQFSPPDGMTVSAWKQKRVKSLTGPRSIRVTIGDPVIEMLPNNYILLTFKQIYESDVYHDAVIKTLTLVKEAEGWKILRERIVQEIAR